ncbi:hypothetical protein B0H17DRAFT_1147237 [Mycena rosella]|uniref:Uncharacterized protein n=1 Tax=Mycena rosella TaxID=1033263 RepID=A0AAD7G406_MYCRO|nr:hypothetical protein B0H17DRAFT_1147237 [Mycena rosella]
MAHTVWYLFATFRPMTWRAARASHHMRPTERIIKLSARARSISKGVRIRMNGKRKLEGAVGAPENEYGDGPDSPGGPIVIEVSGEGSRLRLARGTDHEDTRQGFDGGRSEENDENIDGRVSGPSKLRTQIPAPREPPSRQATGGGTHQWDRRRPSVLILILLPRAGSWQCLGTVGRCNYGSMRKCPPSPFIPQLFGLFLILRVNFAAAALFENFNCPPQAKDGSSALQNSHSFPTTNGHPAVECDYPTGGSCFYAADGSLITTSASPKCPDSLVQVQIAITLAPNLESTSSKTTADSTTSTTTAESTTTIQGNIVSSTTGGESPSTASTSEAQSTSTDIEGSIFSSPPSSAGSVTGGAGGSPTSAPSSTSTSAPSSTSTSALTSTPALTSAIASQGLPTSSTAARNLKTDLVAHSNHSQPAAVAAAVITAVLVVVVLALILIWLRRRRRRNARSARCLPDDIYIPREKEADLEPAVSYSETSTDISSRLDPSGGSSAGGGASDASGSTSSEAANEVLKERLRRVEAHVEALLTLGVPDTAPPEYAA